jgi:hypothetical protein
MVKHVLLSAIAIGTIVLFAVPAAQKANATAFRDVYIEAFSCPYSSPDPNYQTCIDNPGEVTPIPGTPDGIVHPFDLSARDITSISATRNVIWDEFLPFTTLLSPSLTITAGRDITLVNNPTAIEVPGALNGTLDLVAGGAISGAITAGARLNHEDVYVTAPTISLTDDAPSKITIHDIPTLELQTPVTSGAQLSTQLIDANTLTHSDSEVNAVAQAMGLSRFIICN